MTQRSILVTSYSQLTTRKIMLYHFLLHFVDEFSPLNVFRYITFRTGGAVLTSLIICFLFGGKIIAWLKSLQADGQPIRTDGPQSHLITKKGTPTMGGVMILLAFGISTLLWADLTNGYVWIMLLVTFGYGFLGFVDDYLKLTKKNTKGLAGKKKLVGQITIGLVACFFIIKLSPENYAFHLSVPFLKNTLIDLSYFYLVFVIAVMVGASNAVNLTDGLDGLATVPVIIAVSCFGLIVYLVGNIKYSEHLFLPHIPNSGEIAILCGGLIGACLGFLWYNAQPAEVFMGDTGSLSLGGFLGTIAVIAKHEIVLAIIGGLFVMETMSVIIQVMYYKRTGKRIFLMSPIHHHFEKKGWSESKIVIRFWIIAVIFALIGLSTLKLR
jgi:phospho-N-acetylmuramoyl-pentapeptide-transferase